MDPRKKRIRRVQRLAETAVPLKHFWEVPGPRRRHPPCQRRASGPPAAAAAAAALLQQLCSVFFSLGSGRPGRGDEAKRVYIRKVTKT